MQTIDGEQDAIPRGERELGWAGHPGGQGKVVVAHSGILGGSGAETGRTCSTGCEHGDHTVSVFPRLRKGSVSHHVHCYNDEASAYGCSCEGSRSQDLGACPGAGR